MNPILSVIIPVYNSVNFIEKSVNSVLGSSIKELEVILVNDGSTDGTAEICDRLAKYDERIKVIHQSNAGVSAARNKGLRIAEGKYFAFVDSDDYIDAEMYRKMIASLEVNDADMVCCGYYREYEKEKQRRERCACNSEEIILNAQQTMRLMLIPSAAKGISTIACNKLGKTKIQKQYEIYFDEELYECEDGVFWCKYIEKISKCCLVNQALYHYKIYEASSSHNLDITPKKLTQLQAIACIIRICENMSSELVDLAKMRYQMGIRRIAIGAYSYGGKDERLKELSNQLKCYRKQFYFSRELSLKKKIYYLGCAIIVKYNLGKRIAVIWLKIKDVLREG